MSLFKNYFVTSSIHKSLFKLGLHCLACSVFLYSNITQANNKDSAIHISDSFGNAIELKQAATRIISLAPHITENAYAAGIGDALIAAVDHSDYPQAANKLPRIGNYTSISLESIVALKPDLILAWQSGNNQAMIKKLIKLGYPVYLDNPHNFEEIAASIRAYAILGGKAAYGKKVADDFVSKMEKIAQENANKTKLRTFYQVWNEPLRTLNGTHLISLVIELCGGVNIFADAGAVAPLVSRESVIGLNPEVIIASGMGDSRPEWLDEWRRYSMISAVHTNNLHHIHPDILQRHTLRIAQGTQKMCAALDSARTPLKTE